MYIIALAAAILAALFGAMVCNLLYPKYSFWFYCKILGAISILFCILIIMAMRAFMGG